MGQAVPTQKKPQKKDLGHGATASVAWGSPEEVDCCKKKRKKKEAKEKEARGANLQAEEEKKKP